MSAVRRAVFADVDGTLILGNSMAGFLRHHLSAEDLAATVARLRALPTRDAQGAAYYRRLRGVPVDAAMAAGRAWFSAASRAPGFFVEPVVRALDRHRVAGDLIVLVSGSFAAPLAPVAAAVGADIVLCARPVVAAGRYTGRTRTTMLGAAKADAVGAVVRCLDLDRSGCAAYGDHESDLPMLAAVGNPVVVGDDPVLGAWAAGAGLPVVSRTAPEPVRAGRSPA